MAKLGARAGWSSNYCEDLTATKSLSQSDSGKVFFLNSATEFTTTLPSISDAGAGWSCKFIVKAAPSGASYVVTEKTSADSSSIILGVSELEVDTTNDGPYGAAVISVAFVDGVAVKGDWVEFLCDGTSWYANGQTKADGGVLPST